MYRFAIVVATLIVIGNAALALGWAQPAAGKFIRLDEAGLQRSMSFSATWHMKQPILSVADKTETSSGGGINDYASLSRYHWPDPAKPGGLPYIYKDGQTNPEREDLNRYDAIRLEKMVSAVTALSTAYYVTRQDEYAQRAVLWLRTWFINPASRMNPNLNFAQSIPGKMAGSPYGIIETVALIQVVDAAMMLEDYAGWEKTDQAALRQWFRAYLDWLAESPLGIKAKASRNNHGVWYDAQTAAFAYYIGDTARLKTILAGSARNRIQEQILPTGEMPLEMSRTRSLHYVLYNLRAFITLARLGDKVGVNLWDYATLDGRGLKNAIDYVVPYILAEKEWQLKSMGPEKDHSSAVYLAMAAQQYRSARYWIAALTLLGETTGHEELAVRTFIAQPW